MKNFPIVFILVGSLFGCSSPTQNKSVSGDRLKKLQEEDAKLLDSLHEEPMKQGKKTVQTESGITTEIWTSSIEHGSSSSVTETLIYKDGKLISQSYSDPANHFKGSRQFHDGKVIQITNEWKDDVELAFFDRDELLAGRMSYKKSGNECIVYYKGLDPHFENFEKCDQRFNTAP